MSLLSTRQLKALRTCLDYSVWIGNVINVIIAKILLQRERTDRRQRRRRLQHRQICYAKAACKYGPDDDEGPRIIRRMRLLAFTTTAVLWRCGTHKDVRRIISAHVLWDWIYENCVLNDRKTGRDYTFIQAISTVEGLLRRAICNFLLFFAPYLQHDPVYADVMDAAGCPLLKEAYELDSDDENDDEENDADEDDDDNEEEEEEEDQARDEEEEEDPSAGSDIDGENFFDL